MEKPVGMVFFETKMEDIALKENGKNLNQKQVLSNSKRILTSNASNLKTSPRI